MKIYVNDRIVDEGKAKISVFDRGLLYGDGLFETMRSYGGRVHELDGHLDRLYSSARMININITKDAKYINHIIYKLLKINRLKDAYIRLAVTRGSGRVGLDTTTAKDQSMIIIVKEFTPYPDKFYKKGITLYTSSIRKNEKSILSRIKSLNYLDNIMARMEAQAAGANDALLLNTKDEVAESAVSNIFMIKGKGLITPPVESGALPGITRKIILLLAGRMGLRPVERRIKLAELKKAKEVFLTNTLMEIMPVIKIDGKIIASGRPGAVTRSIHKYYRDRAMEIK